jgi:hypothetical protein
MPPTRSAPTKRDGQPSRTRPPAAPPRRTPPVDARSTELQQRLGNRGLGVAFGSAPGAGSAAGPTDSDAQRPQPAAGRELRQAGYQAVQRLRRSSLTIGAANDPAEREAEHVAAEVVRDGRAQRMCAACEQDQEEPAPDVVARALEHQGHPLGGPIRREMERGFGRDLGAVRVHKGTEATQSASAIGARAYTHGNDIVLGGEVPGMGSPEGQRVLAHELTHVVQQGGGGGMVRRDLLDDAGEALASAGEALASAGEATFGAASDVASSVVDTLSQVGGAIEGAITDLASLVGFSEPAEGSPAALRTILSVAQDPTVVIVLGPLVPPGSVVMVRGTLEVLDVAWEVLDNPDPYIERLHQGLGTMMAGVEPIARQMAAAAAPTTGHAEEALDCIWRHLEPKLDYLYDNWWDVLKGMGWDLLWPWPGVAEDFGHAWIHIKSAASHLWDLELGAALDDLLAMLRYVNAAAGRLYGWFFLASVLVGMIGGGIAGAAAGGVGAVPGALAGAAAGASFAGSVGIGLLVSTLVIEGASIEKAGFNLAQTDRSDEQHECDCEIISSSSLTVGITGAMAALGALAARLGKAVLSRTFNRVWRRPVLRGRGKRARGDVLADRFAMSEFTKARLNQRRVTVTDALSKSENFRGLDLTIDSNIQVRSQTTGQVLDSPSSLRSAFANGETVRVTIDGGNVVQVKSHAPGKSLVRTITREIGEVANFNSGTFSGNTVVVTNAGQRTLVVFLREAMSTADEAAVRAALASQPTVRLELIVGGTPSSHPAVVSLDAIPGILAALGTEAGTVGSAPEETSPQLEVRCP